MRRDARIIAKALHHVCVEAHIARRNRAALGHNLTCCCCGAGLPRDAQPHDSYNRRIKPATPPEPAFQLGVTTLKITTLLALGLFGAAAQAQAPAPKALGLDVAAMDKTLRVQDDVYDYANGHWLKSTPIPQDRSSVSIASELLDKSLEQLRGLIETAAKDTAAPANSEARKIGDLYASFMDEKTVEAAGLGAIKGELARIDALKSKRELPALFAHLNRIGVSTPYGIGTLPDFHDTTQVAVRVDQDGLGLPDRDYYLKDDDPRLIDIRARYLRAIEKLLTLAAQPDAAAQAKTVLALETRMAKAQWTPTELRDPVKTYNRFALTQLDTTTPGFAWQAYLADTGVTGKTDYLLMGEPSYFKTFGEIFKDEPLAVWQSYLRWHLVYTYAPYLSKDIVNANFEFFSTALRGTPTLRPRWKRGVTLVDDAIGEGLGKLYAAKYFPPATKARMGQLVDNLLAAYRQDVNSLDWMGPATKRQALEK